MSTAATSSAIRSGLVGGGARHAGDDVLALARRIQAPVVSFRSGRGIVSDDDPLGFTCAEGFECWADTDVLVGIGTRLELTWMRWPDRPPELKTIIVDIDPVQRTRLRPDVAIVGDAATGTRALVAELSAMCEPAPSREEELAATKARKQTEIEELQPHVAYLRAIRAALRVTGSSSRRSAKSASLRTSAFPSTSRARSSLAGIREHSGSGSRPRWA
jgi:acetolactate synthase-1/2/3 large subunit